MKRREFLAGLMVSTGSVGYAASSAGPARPTGSLGPIASMGSEPAALARSAASQLVGGSDFARWVTEQADITLLPGEAQQIQGLLRALRFSAEVDPRIEPAIRFEPV